MAQGDEPRDQVNSFTSTNRKIRQQCKQFKPKTHKTEPNHRRDSISQTHHQAAAARNQSVVIAII